MKHKFYLIFVLFTLAFCASSQVDNTIQTIKYRGIRPDDPGGRCGLLNPERGFRFESYIGMAPGSSIWGRGNFLKDRATKGYSDDWFLMNINRYKEFGITLHQAYCYLTEFSGKPISEEKLIHIQRSLDHMRKAGQKVLLRFAYERNMSRKSGPTGERILQHLEQLAPLIKKNSDVIYVFQAGFVGAWGEWHSSAHSIENDHKMLSKIVMKELEILPKDRMIQLRVMPKYKAWVLGVPVDDERTMLTKENAFNGTPVARFGFANDGTLAKKSDGGTWPEPPFYASPGNPMFDRVTAESPYMAVDGELFWADQGGEIDGLRAARRLRLHHYTSLSIVHSYSGFEKKRCSIDRWMETPVSKKTLLENMLPVSDNYFTDSEGNEVERTWFEYIRDHLGYRIELQTADFERTVASDGQLDVDVKLINRGFATLINPRPVYFVLIDTNGKIVLMYKTDTDVHSWQPFEPGDEEYKPLIHNVSGRIKPEDLQSGEYMLGLWMPDARTSIQKDSRYAVRAANGDVPWWTTVSGEYGINVLGVVEVKEEREKGKR